MEEIIKYFRYALMFPIVVTLLVSIIIIPIISRGNYKFTYENNVYAYGEDDFVWPTPNFTNISSPFGKRVSPTAGASRYHAGIDILAYQGSNVQSIAEGSVIFAGWDNSGGYMVKIKHPEGIESAYCHLSEVIYVKKGQLVNTGQVIGTVGPKYVSNGKLNGATTRSTLTFCDL